MTVYISGKCVIFLYFCATACWFCVTQGLEDVLKCYMKGGQTATNRQLEIIIKMLNTPGIDLSSLQGDVAICTEASSGASAQPGIDHGHPVLCFSY